MAFQAARKALIRLQCMPLDPARLHSAAGDGYLVSVDDGDSWSAGGQCIYLYHLGELAAKIYRLDLKTGKKQYWKSLMPPDLAGDQTEKAGLGAGVCADIAISPKHFNPTKFAQKSICPRTGAARMGNY
jgi:hypothetical protein